MATVSPLDKRLFTLPRGALGRGRQVAGFVVALVAGPLLTWLLFTVRTPESITSDVLAFQILVVVVALVGGIWPALFAAVLSGLTLDFLFVAPQFTVEISDPLHLWALVLYILGAVLVSAVVDHAARRARAAASAAAEAELLAAVAGNVIRGQSAVPALVSRAREAFGMTGVRLLSTDGSIIATDGEPVPDGRVTTIPVGEGGRHRADLELHGGDVAAADRRILSVVVAQLAGALERIDLAKTAQTADHLAATDQVRSALLSAVSHDLRSPLAAAVAAVGGLRASGDRLSPADRDELLATADESLTSLTTLVTDLLDVSRVQAGVLGVSLQPVDIADAVRAAINELHAPPASITVDAEEQLADADPVLLQRVLVNLLTNALRYAPDGTAVEVGIRRSSKNVAVAITDHGPGVAPARRDEMFAPFQRLGDTDNSAGLGLGLALSKGFTEGMGGTLTPEDTPGGGLTMVVTLPVSTAP